MSNLTLWGASEFSKILFGQRAELGDYYLALAIAGNPSSYMSGTEIDEPPPGTGYARLLLPNDSATWDSDGYQTVFNRTKLTFTEAIQNWGYARYWALCNAATGGDVYCYGMFDAVVPVMAGDIAVINQASLKITLQIGSSTQVPF